MKVPNPKITNQSSLSTTYSLILSEIMCKFLETNYIISEDHRGCKIDFYDCKNQLPVQQNVVRKIAIQKIKI